MFIKDLLWWHLLSMPRLQYHLKEKRVFLKDGMYHKIVLYLRIDSFNVYIYVCLCGIFQSLTDFVYAALQLCAAVASWMSVAAIPPLYLSPNDLWLYLYYRQKMSSYLYNRKRCSPIIHVRQTHSGPLQYPCCSTWFLIFYWDGTSATNVSKTTLYRCTNPSQFLFGWRKGNRGNSIYDFKQLLFVHLCKWQESGIHYAK